MSKRLGNAVDPFETLKTYGPDATRWYMISNANPWDNLKFDVAGIEEVKRKFFGTLYNTYAFFSLYANIDGFKYEEGAIPLQERPEIDQWILSELHTLIQNTTHHFDVYFFLLDCPKRMPNRNVHRSRHPTHKGDQKCPF